MRKSSLFISNIFYNKNINENMWYINLIDYLTIEISPKLLMGETLFFVCSECHCLAAMDTNLADDNNSAKLASVMEVSDENSSNLLKELEEISKQYSNNIHLQHPLCYNCTERYIEYYKIINDFMKKFEFQGKQIDNINFKAPEIEIPHQHRERSSTFKDYKYDSEALLSSPTKQVEPRKPGPIRPFPVHTIFIIQFDNMYGTINSCRIGSLKSIPVPQSEVQTGLYLICRYLKYLLARVNIDNNDFIVTSKIIFVIKGKPFELLYQDKKTNVSTFNTALTQMMYLFEQIFTLLSLQAISPPHRIDSGKETINLVSYLFNPNDQFNFVLSMKRLLVNLKAVQMLETFI